MCSSWTMSPAPLLSLHILLLLVGTQHHVSAFQMSGSLQAAQAVRFPAAKRLMGLFRCNGWGPGCSKVEDTARASFTSKASVSQSSQSSQSNLTDQTIQMKWNEMNGVLGHDSALVRQHWAGDNLGPNYTIRAFDLAIWSCLKTWLMFKNFCNVWYEIL